MKSKLFSLKTVALLALAMMFMATGVAQPGPKKSIKDDVAVHAAAKNKQVVQKCDEEKAPDVTVNLVNLVPSHENPHGTPVQAAKISFLENQNPVQVETEITSAEGPYYAVSQMPVYNDRKQPLHLYVTEIAKYPAELLKDKVQGIVIIQVIVEKDGSFTNPKVISSVHPKLDEQALIAVSKLDKGFTPAQKNGETVRCYYQIPVAFLLPPR